MMRKICVLLILFAATNIYSQESPLRLSGVLSLDSKAVIESRVNELPEIQTASGRKSPLLAGLMSALIPGSGEIYSGSYLKGALFLAVEAAAVAVKINYNKKGDNQTSFFQDFANSHWSVERYAQWTLNNAQRINPDITPGSDVLNIFDNNGNVIWSKLNELERAIGHYYSHQLERFGHQQYYEMIGKYPQFNPGWDDFTEDPDDPFTYNDFRKDPVTPHFHYYSLERGKANDFYNVATKAVVFMVVNHVLSAVDAALTAKWKNDALDMNYDIQKVNFGFGYDFIQKFNIRIRF